MKITMKSLIHHLYKYTNLETYKIRDILGSLSEIIGKELHDGNRVRLNGFGIFYTKPNSCGSMSTMFIPSGRLRRKFSK